MFHLNLCFKKNSGAGSQIGCRNRSRSRLDRLHNAANFLVFFLFLFENFALLDLDQHIECGSGSRRKNECGSGSRALIMCTILNRAPPKHTSVLYTSLEISISGAPRVHPRFFRVTLG